MSTVRIEIDGRAFEVEEGRNLLAAALSLGFDVPYFCWHPALGSVGACRQCAVKLYRDADDREGVIAMSCMTPVKDGLRASVNDPEAVAFRRSIIELLMTSHPHDCPVCDEGGECHLQDMTVMTGHVYRSYRFRKRTFRNQDLGPFLTHEMNRCIQCYRCVRFYRDYAGGRDLAQFSLRNHVFFGRATDGVLENEFSGNLAEVCPVGVFNDKTRAERYTRRWDLQEAPSVCPHCGRGCNTIVGARYGTLRRVVNRFNGEVNGYFLCDRGRFGYGFVNSTTRLLRAVERGGGDAAAGDGVAPPPGDEAASAARPRAASASGAASGAEAASGPLPASELDVVPPQEEQPSPAAPRSETDGSAERIVGRLAELVRSGAPVAGIGSPRASLEANAALRRLVGPRRFYSGLSEGEQRLTDLALGLLRSGSFRSPTARDLEAADAVVVLGEDVTSVAPMLAFSIRSWLRLRPTAREDELRIARWNDAGAGAVKETLPSALWSATPAAVRLDDVSRASLHAAPDDIARAALALAAQVGDAAALGREATAPTRPVDQPPAGTVDEAPAGPVGEAPGAGTAPAVAVPLSELSDEAAGWVAEAAAALRDCRRPIVVAGTTCGSAAVLLAAAALARALPGEARLSLLVPEVNTMGLALLGGRPLADALSGGAAGEFEAAVALENDLLRRAPADAVRAFAAGCPYVVLLDHTHTPSTELADAVLPAATFAENSGTVVSHEGRAQRSFSVLEPAGEARESWRWLQAVLAAVGRPEAAWGGVDDVTAALAADQPELAAVLAAAPPASWREAGMKVPRQSPRFSGRTAMHADRQAVEPAPPEDDSSPLAYSLEGYGGPPPTALLTRAWAPGWNSAQAWNKFQEEVGGPLRGDDPGRRLFPPDGALPANGEDPLAALAVPAAFEAAPDEWLVLRLYHVFGSDEQSMGAPAVAGRAPAPYLALCAADVRRLLGGNEGFVRLAWGGFQTSLPVRTLAGLPEGVAGLPLLPGWAMPEPPFRARLTPLRGGV